VTDRYIYAIATMDTKGAEICFIADIPTGILNEEESVLAPKLDNAWFDAVALSPAADLVITTAIFISLDPQFERAYCS